MRLIYSTGLTSLLVGLWVIHTCSAALPNGANNPEEDQQQPARPTHSNRLFNRAIRGPNNNAAASRLSKNQQKAATSSTTTPPAPLETENEPEATVERQEEPEAEVNPNEESASSTTSTEVPTRKQGIAGRQSQVKKDFLERIEKRRKLQQQKGYTSQPHSSTSTTEKPSTKASFQSSRKTVSAKAPSPTPPTFGNQGSHKKSGSNRRYSAKTSTPAQTTPLPQFSSNEAIAEESNLATQSSKIRTYQKARRTSSS